LLHVGRHRPPDVEPAGAESTGREEGQERHWEKEAPEQEAPQSAWQGVQVLRGGVVLEEEEKEDGAGLDALTSGGEEGA
jgi:hypothetical protein